MCELLGMSASTPTDICFSISGLLKRGGGCGPHKDGWGIVFYEDRGIREFRDPLPGCTSEVANLICRYPIHSPLVISHIRKANSGRVCLANTHPFIRELWGQYWSFAHNGQLKGVKKLTLGRYRAVGTTDSEHAFCWLLNEIEQQFVKKPSAAVLWRFIESRLRELAQYGVLNVLMSDSRELACFCTTKLHWTTRRAPFGEARLKDYELQVNFLQSAKPGDVTTVICTEPLTSNEEWHAFAPQEFRVFRAGEAVRHGTQRAQKSRALA